MSICSGTESTTGYGMVGVRTRASLNAQGGGSTLALKPTGLTPEQRAAIQKQINELLILVQQLILKLKALKGL